MSSDEDEERTKEGLLKYLNESIEDGDYDLGM